MALNPGSIDEAGEWIDAECMARSMEDALPPSEPVSDPDLAAKIRKGRRQFLIGIATGVVNHLRAHGTDSFQVTSANTVEIT